MSKKKTVLLIDDDQWLTDQYAALLKHAGYHVYTALHALDGIEVIDRLHPNIIILDMFMPGPNGIVLLHEIRSHSDLSQIPVILCTNSASDLDEHTMAAYGVRAILDKSTMIPEDIVTSVRIVI